MWMPVRSVVMLEDLRWYVYQQECAPYLRDGLDEVPETMDVIPEIHQAFVIANQVNLTREELEDMERREMFIYDQEGAILLGRQEGRQEGREEGMREKAIAIVQELLPRLDDETISQITGISIEEVRSLRSNN